MPYNGSGSFTFGTPGQPFEFGKKISEITWNDLLLEMQAAHSLAICRDGQSTITQDIPFNNHRITGLQAGSAATDSANIQNIMANTGKYVATVGGTVNAITLTPSPAATSIGQGSEYFFVTASTNTGSTTINVSGLGAVVVKKANGLDLVAGDIMTGAVNHVVHDGTNWNLISPYYSQGTWTMSVGGDATYTTRVAHWVKTGRMVHVTGYLVINVLGTGSANIISGLPFTSANISADQALTVSDFNSLATNVVWIGARVNTNNTTVTLRNLTAAGASATSSTLLGNGSQITFGGSYLI